MRAALLFVVLLLGAAPPAARAEDAPAKPPRPLSQLVPPEAQEEPLNVGKATRAYLAQLSGEAKEKSDAYFETGYWLRAVDFLFSLALLFGLLATRASARMRGLAERVTRRAWLQPVLYYLQFTAAMTLLSFPLSVYVGYVREHAYGLSNLTFGGWLAEEAKGFAVGAVMGSLAVALLYAVFRRAQRSWWLWGAGVALVLMVFSIAIAPVFVAPLFNQYKPLQNEAVKGKILALARANGIPVTDVWENDASKQSDRVSANVSGLFGTQRITLNDNLLNRASLPQIEAVMAHEMGHYVLNHVMKAVLFFALIIPLGFAFMQWAFGRLKARAGARWDVRGVEDPAGLPLLLALLTVYLFALTPVLNSFIRAQEQEADQFGVNASQQPDGFAQVALGLSEYRKLDPGPVEELLFYDHPSGRVRIETAMRWKAEHLPELRCRQAP